MYAGEHKKRRRLGPAQIAFRRIAKEKQWKAEEKLRLLKSLRRFGSRYLELLLPSVPKRSGFEVQNFLSSYKRVGQYKYRDPPPKKKWKFARRPKQRKQQEEPPLLLWTEVILKKMEQQFGLNTASFVHLRRILLFITIYEKHPTVEESAGINFRQLYKMLYYYVSGDPPPWMTRRRTHKLFLMTYHWFCSVMNSTLFQDEFSFLCGVDTAPLELYPVNMKTYLRNPPPEQSLKHKTTNVLNVPDRLLHLEDCHIDNFIGLFSSAPQTLKWLEYFYYEGIINMTRTTRQKATDMMMRRIYEQPAPEHMYPPYKWKVIFTPWKYFSSDDAKQFSVAENMQLFDIVESHLRYESTELRDLVYAQMQNSNSVFRMYAE